MAGLVIHVFILVNIKISPKNEKDTVKQSVMQKVINWLFDTIFIFTFHMKITKLASTRCGYGLALANNNCTHCQWDEFKVKKDSVICEKCGRHSFSSNGQKHCICLKGFYRKSKEELDPKAPCHSVEIKNIRIEKLSTNECGVKWNNLPNDLTVGKIYYRVLLVNFKIKNTIAQYFTSSNICMLNNLLPNTIYTVKISPYNMDIVSQKLNLTTNKMLLTKSVYENKFDLRQMLVVLIITTTVLVSIFVKVITLSAKPQLTRFYLLQEYKKAQEPSTFNQPNRFFRKF